MATATLNTTTASNTVSTILERLRPVIEAHRAEGETERNLAKPIIDAMYETGVFQTQVPRAYGGLEMEPKPYYELIEGIAKLDASCGWVSANNSGFPYMCQLLPAEGARDIFQTPNLLIAGGGFPLGSAVPVDGGYRLSGQSSIGSGSKWANWLWSLSVILDDGQPRLGPDGAPLMLWPFFPASSATVLDNWRTMGMRGTGSNDYRYENIFVPDSHAFVLRPFDDPGPGFEGPCYKGRLWYPILGLGAVALGIGRAAVDEGVTLAKTKTPSYLADGLATNAAVQRLLGRADANVSAARAYLFEVVNDIWTSNLAGERATLEQGVQAQLAASFAMEACTRAVDYIHEVVGITGVREEFRFQQLFRDMHTFSQHAFAAAPRFDSAAKVMLGRQSDWGFFYL